MPKREAMTAQSLSVVERWEGDDGYPELERLVRDRLATTPGPWFTTDCDGTVELTNDVIACTGLAADFLYGLPDERKKHYACRCCLTFLNRFGGLVTINQAGNLSPVVWDYSDLWPVFFQDSVRRMAKAVQQSKVTGVFLSSQETLGTPEAGGWTHLSGPNPRPWKSKTLSAEQRTAELREEYGMLCRGLADYPSAVVVEAVRVLRADVLDRSEKTLGVAEWLMKLHEAIDGVKGPRRNNLIWLAVASAPPGYCHVRSTMISTLLDDVKAGVSFEVASRKWKEKMHPLQYRRPTAAPKDGQIDAAEKLLEKTGAVRSLERRWATLGDVLSMLWVPFGQRWGDVEDGTGGGEPVLRRPGMFDHLRKPSKAVTKMELPAVTVSWEKFRRDVLMKALTLELRAPASGGYYGLLTAVHADAPPILQWDGLRGPSQLGLLDRNPCSHYFYVGGYRGFRMSTAEEWGLSRNEWTPVTAVFLEPAQWQQPDRFPQHSGHVFFALQGCVDQREPSLCLFPETLRSEYHGVKHVIEAHSNSSHPVGKEAGNANGYAISKPKATDRFSPITVRVNGSDLYTIDRWE